MSWTYTNSAGVEIIKDGLPYACAECGHLHYEGGGVWSECPIEGCECRGQVGVPYPGFCSMPDKCAGRSSCQRDPNCIE